LLVLSLINSMANRRSAVCGLKHMKPDAFERHTSL
jgi:hypothetical protein